MSIDSTIIDVSLCGHSSVVQGSSRRLVPVLAASIPYRCAGSLGEVVLGVKNTDPLFIPTS